MSHRNATSDAERAVDYKLLEITSSAFTHEGFIPARYACDGANVNPPLNIEHIPTEAVSLVLIVDDPDAPVRPWTHWLAWNIPVTHYIKENNVHGVEGINDFGLQGYSGPCPPTGTHRYFFKVYALDCILELSKPVNKHDLEKAISGHIIAFGEIMGNYTRKT
jgi:Raf kinase inhibitor-like YbhB/YbcL family protein